jgi:uncharacterized membrane protein HdeD (DUF308 family)
VDGSKEGENVEEVSRSWGWVFFFGLLTLVIGVLVMVWPDATLKVMVILFGIQFLITGVFRFVKAFGAGEQHRVWAILLGLLSVGVGIVVLRNLIETLVVIAVIIGIYWVISGVAEFVLAVAEREYPQRGLSIVTGLFSIVAGVILLSWPVKSVTTLAWLIGLWYVVLGILGIIMAFQVRMAAKQTVKVAA